MTRGDPLFKGCTRPPMALGVPMTPLVVVVGSVIALSLFTKLYIALLAIPLVMAMRAIARKDDQQFRLLFLKSWCRIAPHHNFNRTLWRASGYSPIEFRRR